MTLHAVHVLFSDSILPAIDADEATMQASRITRMAEGFGLAGAKVIEWPFTAKDHADGLKAVDWNDVG